jgi:hypothetical protein
VQQNRPFTRFWQARAIREARHFASPHLWYRRATARRRPLPDMVIAGAQKAGTTSLFDYLAGHPQCAASSTKEVHYFDDHYTRGEHWYRMHFPVVRGNVVSEGVDGAWSPAAGRPLCFESSPYYMFDPRVPARMHAALPHAKIVLLMRNPASRAYSHYQHTLRRGREPLSFDEALDAEPARLAGEEARMLADEHYLSHAHRNYSYLARGHYAAQLARFQSLYPSEQLLIVQAERLFTAPAETFARVLAFLGLAPWQPAHFAASNTGRYRSGMSATTRARLDAYFAPHNERLFELLGERYDWS